MRPGARPLALTLAACLSAAALPPRAAFAQDTEATATALFDQGRKLMDAHKYGEACPKLAESQRLAPSGGTLINLAECYEHTGQTASAWATWKSAAARAAAAGKGPAEKKALARSTALEPTLAKLTLTVTPDSDVPGLEVQRDGVPIGHAELGSALAVDPGVHVVEARAPHKRAWSTKVTVAPKQADAHLAITLVDEPTGAGALAVNPAPADLAPPSTPLAGEPEPADIVSGAPRGHTQRTVALVAGGVGVVGLAVGSVFGLIAKSKNDEAKLPQNCPTATTCNAGGINLTKDAQSAATLSTVGFIAGGALLATGAVLWFTAPRGGSTSGLRAAPVVTGSFGGAVVVGSF